MLLTLYKTLNQLFSLPAAALGLPPHACRFTPTCSQYCHQALTTFGPFKGIALCFRRLLRCHPGTPPQHDPLPT